MRTEGPMGGLQTTLTGLWYGFSSTGAFTWNASARNERGAMHKCWSCLLLASLAMSSVPVARAADGEKLALLHCGRCHVVSAANKFGGIDSTPSFAALRSLADWREKLSTFWTASPHAAVVQIAGVTEPFPPDRPPPIAPVELTIEEVEAIQAFIETIEPKQLGGAPR